MSQLFDALRRGRQIAALKAPRTAQGDAVLATLGYAPTRRRRTPRSPVGPAMLLVGAAAAGWVGWNVYHRTPTVARAASATQRPPVSEAPAATSPGTASPVDLATPPAAIPNPAPPAPAPLAAEVNAGPPSPEPRAADPAPQTSEPRATVIPRPSPLEPRTVLSSGTRNAEPGTSPTESDLALALYYHRLGDFEKALQHYRALISRNELDAQAHNNLGLLYQQKNLLDESARELQRALVIDPKNAGTHNNYGVTLLKQGRPDEALIEFGAAVDLAPRSVDALINTALARRDLGQPDLAKETLLRALAIEPKNPSAHYNLAQLYDRTREAARAVEHYRSFLAFAGADHASRTAAVRARIEELTRQP